LGELALTAGSRVCFPINSSAISVLVAAHADHAATIFKFHYFIF